MSQAALARRGNPTLPLRLKALLYHGGKILLFRWPGYTFDDLAACQDSLDGPAFQQVARRMAADPDGRRILAERPAIGVETVDWERLSGLPVDTLGYSLWHHLYSNGIFHDVRLGSPTVRWDEETEYAKKRYRETHDLRHVLVGVGIEGHEEVILQAFQLAQQPQVLSAGIVLLGGLKHALVDGKWREILQGVPRAFRAGRRARFLSLVPFEALWERPLAEVRQLCGVSPVGERYPAEARHPDAPWTPEKGAQQPAYATPGLRDACRELNLGEEETRRLWRRGLGCS